MSRLYIILLGLAALTLATTGAFFSVFGLSQLFAGAAKSVILMATALEFAKLVAAGFLYRYWGHVNHFLRTYLVGAVVTLIAITSVGIFGFLSNAYQKSSFNLRTQKLQLASLESEMQGYEKQIKEFNDFIANIPINRVSRKFEFQKYYDPQIRTIKKKEVVVQTKINELKLEMLHTQTDVGPIIYTAEALGTDVDTVAKYFILIFVLVFDPLAVCLVFCWNLTIRLREKYRGVEAKISARALMNEPVDHRFKKAS